MKQIIIAGMGPGNEEYLTQKTAEAVKWAEVIIGSERLVKQYGLSDKKIFTEVSTEGILRLIEQCTQEKYIILMSGDTGFYSGTKQLLKQLGTKPAEEYNYKVLPGISSIAYFAAGTGLSLEEAAFVSLHGRSTSYIPTVLQNRLTYFLTHKNTAQICKRLELAGLGNETVWIGENLSYANEKILQGTVKAFTEYESAGLTVMAVCNEHPYAAIRTGIPDECFIRTEVPMTKRDIRASVLSRMSVTNNAVVYDIGAGTGSVTVELALQALSGRVYAIERTDEGCELIRKNAERFGLDNIDIIHGNAADVIDKLPAPDAVFIGGSGGELATIYKQILKKNPRVHIVMTAVTLETLQEATALMEAGGCCVKDMVQIAVTQIVKRGRYHMLAANNPVFIIEGDGIE